MSTPDHTQLMIMVIHAWALGPNETPTIDLVVMDDFFYGEPQLVIAQIPQPWSFQLLGLGFFALAAFSRVLRAGARG